MSFNGLVEYYHLELLMTDRYRIIFKNILCYFTLKLTKTAYTYIMSPAEASEKVSSKNSPQNDH